MNLSEINGRDEGACMSIWLQLQESERSLRLKNCTFRNLLLQRLSHLKGAHWWMVAEPQVREWGLNIPGGQKVPRCLSQQGSHVLVWGNGFKSARLGKWLSWGAINHDLSLTRWLQSMLGPYKGLERTLHLPLGEAEWVTIGPFEHSPYRVPATTERDKPSLPPRGGGESKSCKDPSQGNLNIAHFGDPHVCYRTIGVGRHH